MLLELNQVHKREMVLDTISRIDARKTPVQSIAPKGKPITNTLVEWTADTHEEPNQDMAWEDGKDVDSFSNAVPDRGMIRTYAMRILDAAQASDFAENVSDVAGLSKGEIAEAIMKKTTRIARAIEGFMCSDLEARSGAAGVAYRGRGLGVWIQNGEQTTLPVPAQFRTPTTSINTTSVGTLTEANVNDVLESVWKQTGEIDNLQLACGATLKRQFTSFTTRTSGATGAPQIRAYTSDFKGKLDSVVTQYNGDFGVLNLIPTTFNAHPGFDGTTTINPLRGYVFPTNALKMSVKRLPRAKLLEDRGGGPRFLVDWVGAWWVENPLGCGKFAATSAT